MKQVWNQILSGAAALLCAGAAQAYVIDFENVDTSGAPFAPYFITDGDYIAQGGYKIQSFDYGNYGNPVNGSLVGALVNGSDSTTCIDSTCAAGDTSNYLALLNNADTYITGPGQLILSSFNAAFLLPSGVTLPNTLVAYLGVQASRSDGSYATGIFSLNGPSASTGTTSFASFQASDARIIGGTGTLTSGNVTQLRLYGYYCGLATSCAAFATDKGQFEIDNIALNVPAVPEPAEWMLMALGLGAVGGIVRRRRSI